jgi:hypothetical protein
MVTVLSRVRATRCTNDAERAEGAVRDFSQARFWRTPADWRALAS